MKKVKLHLNKSQWVALIFMLENSVVLLDTHNIKHMAYVESMQKIYLRLLNRLPDINMATMRKYYSIKLNMNECAAISEGINECNFGDYERLVSGSIKIEILKQIA